MSKNSGLGRTRNWVFILYPESAPNNWIDLLNDYGVKYCISPLHDKDLNADGDIKKSHRHVILSYDSVKSYEQVKEICDTLNATIPQKVNSMIGAVRYHTHTDNPEKHQYNKDDIICGCGFDLAVYTAKSKTEKNACIDDIVDFIIDNDVTEFWDLVCYCRKNQPDWYEVIRDSHTLFLTNLLKSNRHRVKTE